MAMEAPSATGLRIVLHQRAAGPVSVSSHADRDRIISIVKAVLTKDEHPENFALQAVQEAIKPQKQTVLVQDENQLLENALRTLMQELVSTAVKSSQRMLNHGQIPRLLDIVLYLCEKGHVEGGMIFQLLEDLIEMSTIKDCKEVFGYIETKQDTLGKQELFGRGKLVMLRTCNQLLRRLSKSNDVIFCGRILMFLAHVFPLSERSAVNIKGVFNTSNETKYEKEPPKGVSIDFNFYKTLWSLQEHFCNPGPTTLTQPKWQKFSSNLTVVLDTFEAQPLSEDEGKANNIEQEEESSFSIKYLTSTNLMGLELKDPSFRRHILLQCLILFDYLKAPGKSEKDGPSDIMKEEIKSCEERVKKLLEGLPPKGKEFLQSIEHILEREKNWVWWKRDGCQAYEKQPTEKKTIQEKARKRKKMRLGNKELHNLWTWADKNPDVMTDEKRVKMPSINEYWKPLAEDMDPSAGIEAEYHHKNNKVYCWKGLRFSLRQDLESFCRYTDLGIGVEGVVPQDLLPADVRTKIHSKPADKNNNKRAKKEEPKVPQVVTAPIVEDLEEGEAVMESDIITESNKPSPDDVESGEAIRSENEADIEYTSKK